MMFSVAFLVIMGLAILGLKGDYFLLFQGFLSKYKFLVLMLFGVLYGLVFWCLKGRIF